MKKAKAGLREIIVYEDAIIKESETRLLPWKDEFEKIGLRICCKLYWIDSEGNEFLERQKNYVCKLFILIWDKKAVKKTLLKMMK